MSYIKHKHNLPGSGHFPLTSMDVTWVTGCISVHGFWIYLWTTINSVIPIWVCQYHCPPLNLVWQQTEGIFYTKKQLPFFFVLDGSTVFFPFCYCRIWWVVYSHLHYAVNITHQPHVLPLFMSKSQICADILCKATVPSLWSFHCPSLDLLQFHKVIFEMQCSQ